MVYIENERRENVIVDATSATTRPFSFKESTPLDNTHLLVALVNASTSTPLTVADPDWKAVGTGGANGSNQERMYVRQGNGVSNGIEIGVPASVTMTVVLKAYAGYAGLTPILQGGANGGTGTNFPFSGISGQPGNGVAFLGIGLVTAPSSWSTWSAGDPLPPVGDLPAGARGWWAALDYIDGTGAANSTVTWLGSRSQRYIAAVMPLQTVASVPNYPTTATGTLTLGGTAPTGSNLMVTAAGSLTLTGSAPTSMAGNLSTTASGSLSLGGSATASTVVPSSGTTVPKQSQMPTAPFDLYPAPAYTWGAGSAPSGAGYVSVTPDNPYIKTLGAARKGDVAGSIAGFVNPAPLQDISGAGTGTNPLVYPPHGRRILTNSPEVWYKLGQRSYAGFSNVSSRAALRTRINGKWTSLNPVYAGTTVGFPANPETISAGEYWFKMTFPDSQWREIEVHTHLEFGGVVIPDAYAGQEPRSAEHVAVFLDGSLGASEKHQTGNFSLNSADGSGASATYTAVTSYIAAMCQILGYDSWVNASAGSSGFSINGDTASWKSTNKVPKDVLEHLGDLNFIGSANNDQAAGQTVAQVDTAANTVYGSVAAGAKPDAINVALGMLTAPAMGSQSSAESAVAPYNEVLKARAQQYGFWFINPTTGQTYDPQGNLRLTTSNWVYQDLSDVSSDNTHPSQRGANNLGGKMANAIRMAHQNDTGAVTAAGTLTLSGVGAANTVLKMSTTAQATLTLSGTAPTGTNLMVTAAGSMALAGTAQASTLLTLTTTAAASMTLSGLAPTGTGLATTAVGALTLTGSALATTRHITGATGVLTLNGVGAASTTLKLETTAAATLTLGGAAPTGLGQFVTAAGTLELTGSAPVVLRLSTVSTGVLTLAGVAPVALRTYVSATGSLALSGEASVSSAGVSYTTAVGALLLAGAATAVTRHMTTATGTLLLSGEGIASTVIKVVLDAFGSLLLTGHATARTREFLDVLAAGNLTLGGKAPATTYSEEDESDMDQLENLLAPLPGYDAITRRMKQNALNSAVVPDSFGIWPGKPGYEPTYDVYWAAASLIGFMAAQQAVRQSSSEGTSVALDAPNWASLKAYYLGNSVIAQVSHSTLLGVINLPGGSHVRPVDMSGGDHYGDFDTDVS